MSDLSEQLEPERAQQERETLIVFDFDNTLVHDNTDTRPFKLLAPDILASHFDNKQLRKTLGWTTLVNTALTLLHGRGISAPEILSAVSTCPFPEPNQELLTSISRTPTTSTAILSDANQHFIEACLKAHNLSMEMFEQVFTNFSNIVDSRIVVTPFSTVHGQHACPRCPPNFCKGVVMKQIMVARPDVRVVYVGDGGNDYCPVTTLPSDALVLPRKGFQLEKRILKHPIAANVCVWEHPEQLSAIVREHVQGLL